MSWADAEIPEPNEVVWVSCGFAPLSPWLEGGSVICCSVAEEGFLGGGRSGPATIASDQTLNGIARCTLLRILSISIPLYALGPHNQAVYDSSIAGGPG